MSNDAVSGYQAVMKIGILYLKMVKHKYLGKGSGKLRIRETGY